MTSIDEIIDILDNYYYSNESQESNKIINTTPDNYKKLNLCFCILSLINEHYYLCDAKLIDDDSIKINKYAFDTPLYKNLYIREMNTLDVVRIRTIEQFNERKDRHDTIYDTVWNYIKANPFIFTEAAGQVETKLWFDTVTHHNDYTRVPYRKEKVYDVDNIWDYYICKVYHDYYRNWSGHGISTGKLHVQMIIGVMDLIITRGDKYRMPSDRIFRIIRDYIYDNNEIYNNAINRVISYGNVSRNTCLLQLLTMAVEYFCSNIEWIDLQSTSIEMYCDWKEYVPKRSRYMIIMKSMILISTIANLIQNDGIDVVEVDMKRVNKKLLQLDVIMDEYGKIIGYDREYVELSEYDEYDKNDELMYYHHKTEQLLKIVIPTLAKLSNK